MATKARKVRKNLRLTQAKVDCARRILGTATETETIEQALDLIAGKRLPAHSAPRSAHA